MFFFDQNLIASHINAAKIDENGNTNNAGHISGCVLVHCFILFVMCFGRDFLSFILNYMT